jgi:hypothetical protein
MAQDSGKINPFVLDRVQEDFEIGGRKLVLRPLSVKKVEQLFEIAEAAVSGIDPKQPETMKLSVMSKRFIEKAKEYLKLVFPKSQFDFMTDEFIDEHFTVPALQVLADRIVRMNGLEGFFPHLLQAKGDDPSTPKVGGESIIS